MTTVLIDPTTVAIWEYDGERDTEGWTHESIETMVARVNRGSALLDEKKPGWNFDVVPERLDMTSTSLCIVGQVYGDYDEYVGPLFGYDGYGESEQDAIEHGFITPHEQDEESDYVPWALMDRVWSYLLEARSESGESILLELPAQEPMNIRTQRLIDEGVLTKKGTPLVSQA